MTSLPPFLMTSEEGSFARRTIEERKPLIIDKILKHFDYTDPIRQNLMEFQQELAEGNVTILSEQTSDRPIWDQDIEPWHNHRWLEMPWYLAESYFFRRVLEIVHYFQPGPWFHADPFNRLKTQEMTESVLTFTQNYEPFSNQTGPSAFKAACEGALWGNRGDLSNLDVYETNLDDQSERIILDHTAEAFQFLKQRSAKIAYLFDNVGKELFFDLAFIDHLLRANLSASITCYLKNQPFFVSDAMVKDLTMSLDLMSGSAAPEVQNLAERIRAAINSGFIQFESPPFFTTGRMFREMPETLKNQIGEYDLVILKGDANYRRLFGDRHWEPTTSIGQAGGYFPTSFLSLRTLKSELILGIPEETLEKMNNKAETDWMTNGKRGVITFFTKEI